MPLMSSQEDHGISKQWTNEQSERVGRKFQDSFATLDLFQILETDKNSLTCGPICDQDMVTVVL